MSNSCDASDCCGVVHSPTDPAVTSQIHLEYGGADVTQAFHWLLRRSAFPYRQCSSSSRLDALLLHKLKETYCHVDLVSGDGVGC